MEDLTLYDSNGLSVELIQDDFEEFSFIIGDGSVAIKISHKIIPYLQDAIINGLKQITYQLGEE